MIIGLFTLKLSHNVTNGHKDRESWPYALPRLTELTSGKDFRN